MTDKLVEIADTSARGGFFLFTGNASQLIILAIGSIIIARLLGPNNYGLYTLAAVFPSLLMGLVDFGLNSAFTYFPAKFKAEQKTDLLVHIFKYGLFFKLVLSIVMFVACIMFSDFFAVYALNRPEAGFFIKLAAFLVLFQTIYATLGSVFIGIDRIATNAVVMNVQSIVKTTLSVFLIFLGFSITGAIIGQVAGYMVAALLGSLVFLKFYRGLYSFQTGSFQTNLKTNLKLMLTYSYPLYLTTLLGLIVSQYQTIILALFASNVEVGNFGIAINMAALLNVLVFPLTVLFPAFSKASVSNDVRKMFKLSVKFTALLIIPATVIVAVLSKDLVYLLYGASYNLAPMFLSLYILSFLFTGLGAIVLTYLFNGIGANKVIFKANLILLAVFFPLAPLLTNCFNVLGLIAAFLISSLVSLVYSLFYAIRKFNVTIDFKASAKIFVAALLSAILSLVIILFLSVDAIPRLILSGLTFLLVYLTVIPLTGAITVSELETLAQVFVKIKFLGVVLKPILAYETKIIMTFRRKT